MDIGGFEGFEKGRYLALTISPQGGEGYLLDREGNLRAFDLDRRVEKWRARVARGPLDGIPFALAGRVIVPRPPDGKVACYDAGDGRLLWELETDSPPRPSAGCVLDDETVLLPLHDGRILCVGPDGAASLLEAPPSGVVDVIGAEGVFLVSTGRALEAYRPE